MKTILVYISLTFISITCIAQEMILPLQVNTQLSLAQTEKGLKAAAPDTIKVNTSVSKIIVLDDFSYNTLRLNPEFWANSYVYVNRTFAFNPVSLGVATFDGLNERGYPYNFTLNTSYGACDTLTTLPIELANVKLTDPGVDTVFMSFLFQPQGINPFANSSKDSLVLQFRDVEYKMVVDSTSVTDTGGTTTWIYDTSIVDVSVWHPVWSREGSGVYEFQQAIIKVDPALYKNGFQFRFISYGNTSGSVDHWHIDNIYMSAEGRSAHEDYEDVAFQHPTSSRIKDYEAMPWFHYFDNPTAHTKTDKMRVFVSSSHDVPLQMQYEYRAYDLNNNLVDSINKDSAGGFPIQPNSKNQPVAIPDKKPYKFIFPTNASPKNSITYFRRETMFYSPRVPSTDLFQYNNIIREYQVFGTYYAYDDGTAEAGYGLKAQGGSVALRFHLPVGISDYITSFYMHFNPVVENRSIEKVRLTIWADADEDSIPDDIIYQNPSITSPIYPKELSNAIPGVNAFQRIFLDDSIEVSGTFFIGWEKITSEVINIGYDLNKNNSDKLYIDIGGGWVNSGTGGSIDPGTIMLRPSFSSMNDNKVGIDQRPNTQESLLNLYPNPAKNQINISLINSDEAEWQAKIYRIDGSLMESFHFQEYHSLSLINYTRGIYLLNLTSSNGKRLVEKFIVNP